MRYEINLTASPWGTVHDVDECNMIDSDRNPKKWIGPYATRGAAIDAVLSIEGKKPRECSSCINHPRLTVQDKEG